MFETLTFLALIPLALAGAGILIFLGWLLLPYAALFYSLFAAALMMDGPNKAYAWIPVVVALLSLAWIKWQWTAGRRR